MNFSMKIMQTSDSYNLLSYQNDLLSQWRGYADDGRGAAIGFDRMY